MTDAQHAAAMRTALTKCISWGGGGMHLRYVAIRRLAINYGVSYE